MPDSRWQVRDWHGSWSVVAPSGRTRHARDLDELFALLPPPRFPLPTGECETAVAPVPAAWQVQAALVWVAAARAAGLSAELVLPVDADCSLRLDLVEGQLLSAQRAPATAQVCVTAATAEPLLDSLLRAVSGVDSRGTRSISSP